MGLRVEVMGRGFRGHRMWREGALFKGELALG